MEINTLVLRIFAGYFWVQVTSMLYIQRFVFNPLQENTYVLYDDSGACAIVDPGCYETYEKEELDSFITENKLQVTTLLNTHGHVDHVLGNAFVKRKYGVPLAIHKIEEDVLRAVKVYAPHYGFYQYEAAEPDKYLIPGEEIQIGTEKLLILFVPGHSPGHVAFYHVHQKIVIGGDVLFYGSIGRTDLPGGNYDELITSIHQQLFILPDDVVVYPGHGMETTIGYEKRTNPFCATAS